MCGAGATNLQECSSRQARGGEGVGRGQEVREGERQETCSQRWTHQGNGDGSSAGMRDCVCLHQQHAPASADALPASAPVKPDSTSYALALALFLSLSLSLP